MRALILFGSLLVGCASAPIVGPDLSQVRVYPKAALKMGKSSMRKASGTLMVQVDNHGDKPVSLGAVQLSMRDAEKAGIVETTGSGDGGGETLGAGEGMAIPVALSWSWPEGDDAFLQAVEQKTIKLLLDGTVKVAGEDLKVVGPTAVPAPVLPVVTVRHVEATRDGSLSSADLGFRVEVRNDNFFAVSLSNVTVSVSIEGVEMAKDQVLSHGEKVSASSSIIMELPITMDGETHGKNLRNLLKRGSLNYTMTGKISYHGLSQPLDLAGVVQFPEF